MGQDIAKVDSGKFFGVQRILYLTYWVYRGHGVEENNFGLIENYPFCFYLFIC